MDAVLPPLHYAIIHNSNPNFYKLLIESGADVNYNHILIALVYKRSIKAIKYLAERVDINQAKLNFEYILTCAIVTETSLDIIKYLIDKWLDINYVSSKGENTILYVIRAGGSVHVMEYLESKGVQPSSCK